MQIALGCDHRGVEVKNALGSALKQAGHNVVDLGTFSSDSVDYPDIAGQVAGRVSRGEADRGILICGTGIGMSIAANKYPGVRAAPCHDEATTKLFRQHNNGNVLCLPANTLDAAGMERLASLWLTTPFEGGRHATRIDKISALEPTAGTSPERTGSGCG
jgi:ribose 5-phosphate isomerase B